MKPNPHPGSSAIQVCSLTEGRYPKQINTNFRKEATKALVLELTGSEMVEPVKQRSSRLGKEGVCACARVHVCAYVCAYVCVCV